MLRLKYKVWENILCIFNLNSLYYNYLTKTLKNIFVHNNIWDKFNVTNKPIHKIKKTILSRDILTYITNLIIYICLSNVHVLGKANFFQIIFNNGQSNDATILVKLWMFLCIWKYLHVL